MGRVVHRHFRVKTKEQNIYQRLPGSRLLSVGIRPSLWLASEHLLALERTVGSERYRRFYLRDVEALIVRRTQRRAALNGVFTGLAVLGAVPFLIVFFRNPNAGAALATSLIIGGLFLIPAVINTLRGPTCETRIRTAVQIEPLPSLGRVRAVEKVLLRIKPLIAQAQGEVTPDQIAAADWGVTRLGARSAFVAEPIPREGAPKPERHEPGRLHAALFATFLVVSAISFWEAAVPSKVATGVDLSFSLSSLLLLIFAIRRQAGSDLPAGVKRLTWAGVAFFLAGFAAGIVYAVIYVFRHGGQQPSDTTFFRGEPGYTEMQVVFGLVALFIGVAGLALLKRRNPAATAIES